MEPLLTAYIRRHWKVAEDVIELRQDVYERALVGARRELPVKSRAYVFAIAHNHLINHAKRAKIVVFETIADLDTVDQELDLLEPERAMTARDELRHAQVGIEKLPPRCRDVVRLRKLDGLSTMEAAHALGVSPDTIRQQLKYGMKALIDHMLGGPGKVVRTEVRHPSRSAERP